MSLYPDDEDAPQDKEVVAYGMVLNLIMLSVAATIGLFYSCKFFHSPDVMVIPGQSPAQSFVMFAVCFLLFAYSSGSDPEDNGQCWLCFLGTVDLTLP